MLTSDTINTNNNNIINGGNINKTINTTELKNKLLNINSESTINTEKLENKLLNLIKNDNNIFIKKNNFKDDNIINNIVTTTDLNTDNYSLTSLHNIKDGENNIFSATSDNMISGKMIGGKNNIFSATSDNMNDDNIFSTTSDNMNDDNIFSATSNNMIGGKMNDDDNIFSATSDNMNYDLIGGKGPNPGMQAFLTFKKYVAKKLNIPNGVNAAKIAGKAQKDFKDQHPDVDKKVSEELKMKYFDDNINNYKKLINKK